MRLAGFANRFRQRNDRQSSPPPGDYVAPCFCSAFPVASVYFGAGPARSMLITASHEPAEPELIIIVQWHDSTAFYAE